MLLAGNDNQLRIWDYLRRTDGIFQGDNPILIAVKDEGFAGVISDYIINLKGDCGFIVNMPNRLPHNIAGGRKGAIGQRLFLASSCRT